MGVWPVDVQVEVVRWLKIRLGETDRQRRRCDGVMITTPSVEITKIYSEVVLRSVTIEFRVRWSVVVDGGKAVRGRPGGAWV